MDKSKKCVCGVIFDRPKRIRDIRWKNKKFCSKKCRLENGNTYGTIEDRFWKNVPFRPVGECWLWNGHRASFGHGLLCRNKKQQLAHRLSYEINVGDIPAGLVVRHKCDVASCVNPDHLETGTQRDNIQDAVKRGRWQKGERSGKTFLKSDQVLEIYKSEGMYTEIGEKFGIRPNLVRSIKIGRTWGHLTGHKG